MRSDLCCACAASLARKVYMRQNVGVGQFARQYGGRNKRKGTVPEHYARASRGLIRHILKQVGAHAGHVAVRAMAQFWHMHASAQGRSPSVT